MYTEGVQRREDRIHHSSGIVDSETEHVPFVGSFIASYSFRERLAGGQVYVHVHKGAEYLSRPPPELRHVVDLPKYTYQVISPR